MKNKYQIILFIVFLLLLAGFSFILISEKRLKNSQKSTSNKPFKEPSLSLPKEDKGLFYANLELELRDKRINNNYPQSLLFAIQIGYFHQDWECNSLGYDNNGFTITCRQKPCSFIQELQWPRILNSNQIEICNKEFASREYPQNFNTLTIFASEYETKEQIIDYSKIINKNKLRVTEKGRLYEFDNLKTSKYSNSYSAVFYSPFELTKRLSKMSGTFYGSDWIYAKYTIKTDINGDNITELEVDNLFKKIIDSITFIYP